MFKGFIVLITGAASGIGLEIAKQFVKRGATVVGTDIDEKALQEAKKNLGQPFIPKICDVSQKDQLVSISNYVEINFGKLDFLVNNAGRCKIGIGPETMEEEDYFYHYDVIVKGAMLLVKYVVPLLRKAKKPSIINISSGAARVEYSNHFLYSTAKAALEKYTRHLVRDLPGIRANTILPGWIDTPLYTKGVGLTDEIKENLFNALIPRIPCRRIGKPEDIANCVIFLCSEEASYINGASILIDGGVLYGGADWGI